MTDQPPFKEGDIIRLKKGTSLIKVMEMRYIHHKDTRSLYIKPRKMYHPSGWYVRHKYFSSLMYTNTLGKWRIATDFELVKIKKEEEPMKKLYMTKETPPRYGEMMTKGRNGHIVLDMKGKDAAPESFAPDDIVEVLPYTVELVRFSGDSTTQKHEYEMNEGDVKVGDIVVQLSNGSIWSVTKVDTQQRHPHPSQNGFFKLEGKRLGNF